MTLTNIKELPEGKNYFTEIGYSQSYPWVEIRRTKKTVTIVQVIVKKDPNWKPNFISGGFAGHCINQNEQTWLFDKFDNPETIIRLTKAGWSNKGVKFIEGSAREFYDYNF